MVPDFVPAPRTERSQISQPQPFPVSEQAWHGDESVFSRAKQARERGRGADFLRLFGW